VVRIFYGWWVVFSATLASALNGGVFYYGFGAWITPLTHVLTCSRAALSGAFSLGTLVNGALAPFIGLLVDRYGPWRLMLMGSTLLGLAWVLLSQTPSIAWFYGVTVLLMFAIMLADLPLAPAVAHWFMRRMGTAMGILGTGFSWGGVVVPLLAWLINAFGWNVAAWVTGLVVGLAGVPLALVVRRPPQPEGYLADVEATTGARPQPLAPQANPVPPAPGPDLSARQAVTTSAFWLMTITFSLRHVVTTGLAIHQIPFLIDIGISPQVAALFVSSTAMASIGGNLAFGWLGDRWDKRRVCALGLGLMVVGMLILARAQGLGEVALFVLVYALGFGGTVPMMAALRGEYFGRRAFATIQGLSQTVHTLGSMAGPLVAGYIRDVTQSYRLAFVLFAVINVLGIFMILFMRHPRVSEMPEAAESGLL